MYWGTAGPEGSTFATPRKASLVQGFVQCRDRHRKGSGSPLLADIPHTSPRTRQAAGPPWQELSRQFPWQYPMAGAGRGRGGPIPAAGWPCPHEAAAPWPPQRWLHPSPPPPLLPHRRRLGGCRWPDVGPDPANTAAGATLGLCRVWIRPRMGRSPWCRGIPFLHPVWKPRWDKGSDVLGHPQDVASASLPWLGPGGQDRALRGQLLGSLLVVPKTDNSPCMHPALVPCPPPCTPGRGQEPTQRYGCCSCRRAVAVGPRVLSPSPQPGPAPLCPPRPDAHP